jgi:sugar lactone lactonase YvrE
LVAPIFSLSKIQKTVTFGIPKCQVLMSKVSPEHESKILLSGLAMPESARWHDGRLWFANWGASEIIAVDLNGKSEVITGNAPPAFGWSIDWLHDGRLLVTGKELMRLEPDGSMTRHADLSSITEAGWNEIVVDGRGNTYVNSINFNFLGGERPQSGTGVIALVTPDGEARKVAGDLSFPNGMVITPDNSTLVVSESFTGRLVAFDIASDGSLSKRRVWAEGLGPDGIKMLGPDGIKMDAEGAIWVQAGDIRAATHRADSPEGAVLRIREGGKVLQRIEHDKDIFAVTLGGPDGKTLFMLATAFRGVNRIGEVAAARIGEVLITKAPAQGAGWP